MKIAVTAWNLDNNTGESLAQQAETAEAMGFHGFWLPENHFNGLSSIPSPLMLLANVASRTTHIHLGTTSYLLPIRNPLLAAEEVAVLDQLSAGRVILGIGRGFQDSLFATFKIRVRDKRKHFKANLDLMIDAWQGKPVHIHEGKAVYLSPLPVQKPHPPLWVAAFGPLAIRQAGQLGLPYIASPVETLAGLKTNIELHHRHVREAGLPDVTVKPVMRTIFISRNPSLNAAVRSSLSEEATRLRDKSVPPDEWCIVGDPDYARDKIMEYHEELGMDYLIARGRIQGVSDTDQIASHRLLTEIIHVS